MTEQLFIEDVVERLQGVPGTEGIVLGGANARGNQPQSSGTTFVIYYDSQSGMAVHEIFKLATTMDDVEGKFLLKSMGEWRPWMNLGVTVSVQQSPVKFLFRDVRKLSDVIDECNQGIVNIEYQIGHPHCFTNVIYLGEISLGEIIWDRSGKLAVLKERTKPYPSALKQFIIERFLWEASYSLQAAAKSVSKKDFSYTAGHCYRVISCLHQVLFALNEVYGPHEMEAADLVDSLEIAPPNYKSRVNEAFRLLNTDRKQTETALDILRSLLNETVLRI